MRTSTGNLSTAQASEFLVIAKGNLGAWVLDARVLLSHYEFELAMKSANLELLRGTSGSFAFKFCRLPLWLQRLRDYAERVASACRNCAFCETRQTADCEA